MRRSARVRCADRGAGSFRPPGGRGAHLGHPAAKVRTTAEGAFSVVLPPGEYTLIPEPVEGLLGTAAAQDVVVETGPVEGIDFSYDTGIR